MNERKIKWHPRTLKICQIPTEGLEYAFLSKDYVQIHQFVWCKDFMQDVIWGSINNKMTSIYGFCYDPAEDPPVDFEKTHILLNSYKDTNFGMKVRSCLPDFLHQIESELKMKHTVFEKALNPHWRYKVSGIYIAISDSKWMQSPPMISLYTMLLRVGMVHTKGQPFMKTIEEIKKGEIKPYYGRKKLTENDQYLLRTTDKGFKRILKDPTIFHEKMEDNFPKKCGHVNIGTNHVHESFGLTNFSTGYTRSYFPEWHKDY